MSFQKRLKQALTESGLTQGEVARRAGITPGALTMWKNGTIMNPEARHVASMARILGISSDWLIDGKGPMKLGQENSSVSLIAQRPARDGFKHMEVPVKLIPMVEAWIALYADDIANEHALDSLASLAVHLNPKRAHKPKSKA